MNKASVEKISIATIKLEKQYRKTVESELLTQDIYERGLVAPLEVEGPTQDDKYILVHGYRRYNSLLELGFNEANCIISPLTNERTRMIKRLGTELHSKKKTSYELERIIKDLLDQNCTIEQIAAEVNVHPYTIKRHIKGLDIDREIMQEAEKKRLGKDGLVRLMHNSSLTEERKSSLLFEYLNKIIFSYHIDVIDLLSKIPLFSDLPDSLQKRCIDEAFLHAKFTEDEARNIVCTNSIKYIYDKRIANMVFSDILDSLDNSIKKCDQNIISNLDDKDRVKLKKLGNEICKIAEEKVKYAYEKSEVIRINVKLRKIEKPKKQKP